MTSRAGRLKRTTWQLQEQYANGSTDCQSTLLNLDVQVLVWRSSGFEVPRKQRTKSRFERGRSRARRPAVGRVDDAPHPASIRLYKEGQGYPKFDAAKAKVYFQRVNEKIARLVFDVVRRWDAGKL